MRPPFASTAAGGSEEHPTAERHRTQVHKPGRVADASPGVDQSKPTAGTLLDYLFILNGAQSLARSADLTIAARALLAVSIQGTL